MCLAVPARIVAIQDNIAEIELSGVLRKIGLDLVPETKIGDYVLVHAGFAIQVIDEKEALETLALFKEILENGVC